MRSLRELVCFQVDIQKVCVLYFQPEYLRSKVRKRIICSLRNQTLFYLKNPKRIVVVRRDFINMYFAHLAVSLKFPRYHISLKYAAPDLHLLFFFTQLLVDLLALVEIGYRDDCIALGSSLCRTGEFACFHFARSFYGNYRSVIVYAVGKLGLIEILLCLSK